jgi:hypothetical protein
VLVPDLSREQPRWPIFGAAVQSTGAAGVFVFPLCIGTTGLGALTLYRDTPGPLGAGAVQDAGVLAAAVAAALVRRILPSAAAAHPDGAETTSDPWRDSPHDRGEIHQATGVISASLHLPVGAAYARLSGHAFVTGTTMAVVAHDVVAHRLLLPEDPG